MIVNPTTILHFWFQECTAADWFTKNEAFDALLKQRFHTTLIAAKNGECFAWRKTIHGRLAEIIILDQFSRNVFRDTPAAFAQDSMALVLSQEAIESPEFSTLSIDEKKFMLMPMMHSESKIIHEIALEQFTQLGDAQTLEYEILHKQIIDRFNRYPHRNIILNRQSTDEELAFLQEPNSSF